MTTEASTPAGIDSHVRRISAVVILGMIMSILDATIVNVALKTLGSELHSPVSEIQWVVTGYMLALAAVIPVAGWCAMRFGARQVYLTSMALFTLGSVLCGVATSTTELVIFRVLQGIGGGMIMPVGQMMMARAAGPKRMGRVMGIVAIPAMLAPIFGPTLGGLLIQNASWRWIFWVNLPVGIVAMIAGLRFLPKSKPGLAGKLDVPGLLLMAGGLPLFTYGLAEIGTTGSFTSSKVIIPCTIGVLLVAAFVVRALRIPNPLLDMRLYRRPTFASASVAMFCLGAGLFGSMILLPLYWQTIRFQSVVDTGLLTGPQGLGMALVMPIAGKLTDRIGGGPLALIGVIITTIATIPFGFVGAHTSIPWLFAVMLVRGTGIGLAFMPTMGAAFASLHRDELPHATPQLNVLQRVGGSIGTAILAVVLERALSGVHTLNGEAHAYGIAFWASAIITAVAIVPCYLLMRAEREARAHPEEHPIVDDSVMAETLAA